MTSPGRVVVGVDFGTTATKIAALDEAGVAHGLIRVPNRLSTTADGRAEQDPEELISSALEALARVCGACRTERLEVTAVALGCAMHGIVGVDEGGRPLTPLLTWADRRAEAQARRLREGAGGSSLYLRTGTPLHPSSPLAKLMWFREREPALFARVGSWLSVKELLLLRLFGRRVVDVAVASATGLLDVRTQRWDPEAVELAGLAPDQLSEPVPMTHRITALTASDAQRLELARDTPFVVGGSDGALSSIGLGAMSPGVAGASVGTSAAVRTCADRPGGDEDGVTFCFALGRARWLRGAASNSAGGVVAWLRDLLRAEPGGLDELLSRAAEVPVGADGLLFLPYLHGERAPRRDPGARAVLFGLRAHHGAPEIARAVLEGLALHLASVVELVDRAAGPVNELRVGGGLTRTSLWRRILTDCLRRPVSFSSDPEVSLRGAMHVGLEALGRDGRTEPAGPPALERREPTEASSAYEAVSSRFEDLRRRVEPLFAEGAG